MRKEQADYEDKQHRSRRQYELTYVKHLPVRKDTSALVEKRKFPVLTRKI